MCKTQARRQASVAVVTARDVTATVARAAAEDAAAEHLVTERASTRPGAAELAGRWCTRARVAREQREVVTELVSRGL